MKITILKLTAPFDLSEPVVHVFDGWLEEDALENVIDDFCSARFLEKDDLDDTWFKNVDQTCTAEHLLV